METVRPAFVPLVLPAEHGSWSFLLEPILLGMLVAPSRGGMLVAVACVAAFLVRQPLRLALLDRKRARFHPRTRVCEHFAAAFAALGTASLVAAVVVSSTALLLPLLLAAPLACAYVLLDSRRRGRALLTEAMGAIAPGAAAAAIALAAGRPAIAAFALWALIGARAVASILYVRSSLGRGSHRVMLASHLAALLLAVAIGRGVAAMAVLLARALLPHPRRARQLGMREIVYGVATVALIAAG